MQIKMESIWSIFCLTDAWKSETVQITIEKHKCNLTIKEYLLKIQQLIANLASLGYAMSTSDQIEAMFAGSPICITPSSLPFHLVLNTTKLLKLRLCLWQRKIVKKSTKRNWTQSQQMWQILNYWSKNSSCKRKYSGNYNRTPVSSSVLNNFLFVKILVISVFHLVS